jgi:tRNA pseudouridine38-40 synthase
MARYQLILAYDGTDFKGFQRQAKARTVQGVVEAALRQLGWQGRAILASGRTDTGVHALGQVIAFDFDWKHAPEDLGRALNASLPKDVSVSQVRVSLSDFNPRNDAVSRSYRYDIYCEAARHPLFARYAWHVWPAPDFRVLNEAAGYIIGKHDFSAFGNPLHPRGSTLRTVFQAEWRTCSGRYAERALSFEISADAFLYHMVRRLVSFLVDIGQGNREIIEIIKRLDEPVPVQGLAPPQGLTLVEVRYREYIGEHDGAKDIHTENE